MTENRGRDRHANIFDPFRLEVYGRSNLTSEVAGYIVGATLIISLFFCWDFIGSMQFLRLYLHGYGPAAQSAVSIVGALLFSATMAYALHRAFWIHDPHGWQRVDGTWSPDSGLSLKYLGYVAVLVLLALALVRPVEMFFFRGDIDGWIEREQNAIAQDIRGRETGLVRDKHEALIANTSSAAATAQAAFATKEQQARQALLDRRTAGASNRSQQAERTLRAARIAGTRTSTVVAIAAANSARTAALSGVAGGVVTSQDDYEKETERLIQEFDRDAPKRLAALVLSHNQGIDALKAGMNEQLASIKAMDVHELVTTYESRRHVPTRNLQDTTKALAAVRKGAEFWFLVILGVGLGLVFLFTVYKWLTWSRLRPYYSVVSQAIAGHEGALAEAREQGYSQADLRKAFWTDGQKACHGMQQDISDATTAFFAAAREQAGAANEHGTYQSAVAIVRWAEQEWRENVSPKLTALTRAETELGNSGLEAPEWNPDLEVGFDPRRTKDRQPWGFSRAQLAEWGWKDPTEAIELARKAVQALRDKYREFEGLVKFKILQPLMASVRQHPQAQLQVLQRWAMETFIAEKLPERLYVIAQLEELARRGGEALPQWPLESVFSRASANQLWLLSEEFLRYYGWQGEWIGVQAVAEETKPVDEVSHVLSDAEEFEKSFNLTSCPGPEIPAGLPAGEPKAPAADEAEASPLPFTAPVVDTGVEALKNAKSKAERRVSELEAEVAAVREELDTAVTDRDTARTELVAIQNFHESLPPSQTGDLSDDPTEVVPYPDEPDFADEVDSADPSATESSLADVESFSGEEERAGMYEAPAFDADSGNGAPEATAPGSSADTTQVVRKRQIPRQSTPEDSSS